MEDKTVLERGRNASPLLISISLPIIDKKFEEIMKCKSLTQIHLENPFLFNI